MGILLMIFLLLFGAFFVGLAWGIVFWIASFLIYVISCILAALGLFLNISGDKNLCYLFLVIVMISLWILHQNWADCGWVFAILSFISGVGMLYRSADMWKIGD